MSILDLFRTETLYDTFSEGKKTNWYIKKERYMENPLMGRVGRTQVDGRDLEDASWSVEVGARARGEGGSREHVGPLGSQFFSRWTFRRNLYASASGRNRFIDEAFFCGVCAQQ